MTNSHCKESRTEHSVLRRTAGFTLIEILLVMLIIVALAGISIPLYGIYIDKAKTTLAKSTLATTRTVMEDYQIEHQTYPQTINFATGLDDLGRVVMTQSLVEDFQKNIFAVDSYAAATSGYTLRARARDKNHTLFTLTPAQGIIQEP